MNRTAIINIGDELVFGQTINTNAAFISQHLTALGFNIAYVKSVPDNIQDIQNSFENNDGIKLFIVTGGLGPTKDDITKAFICQWFDTSLVLNQSVLNKIQHLFHNKQIPMLEEHRTQAMLPKGAQLLNNTLGTAPGMYLEKQGSVYVFLPGVPSEMKQIFSHELLPLLKTRFHNEQSILHKYILTNGIGESYLSNKIRAIEDNLPDYIGLAYLPQINEVKLRLTGQHNDADFLENQLTKIHDLISTKIEPFITAKKDTAIEKVIANILIGKQATLSVAESCTGGFLSHTFTALPGASQYFTGSCVCYSNEIKQHILGVHPDTLAQHGAVSAEVVSEMLDGTLKAFNTSCAIAVSGVAGPTGGTKEKPVGTVYIGASTANGKKIIKKKYFTKNRQINIEAASKFGMYFLFCLLTNKTIS